MPLDDLESIRESIDLPTTPPDFIEPDDHVTVIAVPVGRIAEWTNGNWSFGRMKAEPDKLVGEILGIGCVVCDDTVVTSPVPVEPKTDRCTLRSFPIPGTSIFA